LIMKRDSVLVVVAICLGLIVGNTLWSRTVDWSRFNNNQTEQQVVQLYRTLDSRIKALESLDASTKIQNEYDCFKKGPIEASLLLPHITDEIEEEPDFGRVVSVVPKSNYYFNFTHPWENISKSSKFFSEQKKLHEFIKYNQTENARDFLSALVEDPANENWLKKEGGFFLLARANLEFENGNWEKGIEMLDKLWLNTHEVKLFPAALLMWANFARSGDFEISNVTLLERYTDAFFASYQLEDLWGSFKEINYFEVARYLYRMDILEPSNEIYQFIIDRFPQKISLASVYYNKGWGHFFLGDNEGGMKNFKEAFQNAIYHWAYPLNLGSPDDKKLYYFVEFPEADENLHLDIIKAPASAWNFLGKTPDRFYPGLHPGMFGYQFKPKDLYIYSFENVEVEQFGIFHTADGIFYVPDNRILDFTNLVYQWDSTYDREIECGVALSFYNDNFYHFLAEGLPALAALLDNGFFDKNPNCVVVSEYHKKASFHKEILDLIGFPEEKFVYVDTPTHFYKFKKMFVATWPETPDLGQTLWSSHCPPAWAVQSLLRQTNLLKTPVKQDLVIFLSRENSAFRNTRQDAYNPIVQGLTHFLGPHFFSLTLVDRPTVKQQIEYFRRAKVILAPHGAALALTMFCAPGTKIIEFPCGRPVMTVYFSQLASIMGLDYYAMPSLSARYYGMFDTKNAHVDQILGYLQEWVPEFFVN